MALDTKRVLLAVAGVWVALLAFFTAPMLWQVHREWRNVDRVFSAYTADLAQGRFEEAYKFCGPDFRAQSSSAEFVTQQQLFQKQFGQLHSVKIRGMRVTETGRPAFWTARISADLNYESSPRRFEFSFRKQAEEWVLYGFEEAGPSNGGN